MEAKPNMPFKHREITDKILSCFYTTYNQLGYGFLEKVYENSLVIELQNSGLLVAQQYPITVVYRDQVVGEYLADLVVENAVIVEVKAVRDLIKEHEAQLLNYLKATQFEVGLLLNFGPAPQHIRKAFENERKQTKIYIGKH